MRFGIAIAISVLTALAGCSDQETEQRQAAAEKLRVDKRLCASVLLHDGVLVASDSLGTYGMPAGTGWLVSCSVEGLNVIFGPLPKLNEDSTDPSIQVTNADLSTQQCA